MNVKKGVFNMPAIRAAKDLCYGENVVDKLKKAISDNEITRIMFTARNAKWSGKRGFIT